MRKILTWLEWICSIFGPQRPQLTEWSEKNGKMNEWKVLNLSLGGYLNLRSWNHPVQIMFILGAYSGYTLKKTVLGFSFIWRNSYHIKHFTPRPMSLCFVQEVYVFVTTRSKKLKPSMRFETIRLHATVLWDETIIFFSLIKLLLHFKLEVWFRFQMRLE